MNISDYDSICDIDELLENEVNICAHTSSKKDGETLTRHSYLALNFFKQLEKEKGIDKILSNIVNNLKIKGKEEDELLPKDACDIIIKMFIDGIYLHDLGKINPAFQVNVLKNEKINLDKEHITNESKHSLLSAILYIDIYREFIEKNINDKKIRRYLYTILFNFSYAISRHHSYLEDLSKCGYTDKLQQKFERLKKDDFEVTYYKFKDRLLVRKKLMPTKLKDEYDPIDIYILSKLLYSAIVCCDFYATYKYFEENESNLKYINNIDDVFKVYINNKIYKDIQGYKNDKSFFGENNINSLRSELFLESESKLLKKIDKGNIYYLEAPTGSGKTNTSINLSLNIIKQSGDINKIFYIFPFNTLVEQTKATFDSIFNEKIQQDFKVAVINSMTPIITEEEFKENEDTEDINYGRDLLNRQMLNYSVVLTTHVNFFNYLFGVGREVNLPLISICNSVVIIDEIQSYRNSIWPEIIKFLNKYSKLLNIKIIIMSATLPKLDDLMTNDKETFVDLIEDKGDYYNNIVFKDRVILNFDMLSKHRISEEKLIEEIDKIFNNKGRARVLVEFITKKSARYFYNKFKEKYKGIRTVVEITGDDSNYNRKKIINEINKKDDNNKVVCEDILVIATQVIEAGVDIDMDIGFKDISMLDGEEQFLGRINRSFTKKGCYAYFFNYDDATRIYKDDFRLEYNLLNREYQEYLKNKNFREFYNNCFKRLKDKKNELNENNIDGFYKNEVMNCDFQKIYNHMKLIQNENYQIFLAYDLEIEDKKIIKGIDVWNEYEKLINDKTEKYAKNIIDLSKIAERMAYFTYNYSDFGDKVDRKPKLFDKNIGNFYLIENGKEFITEDGKFDRDKYYNQF
ncbi:CRISPR-associated helicase Cas3' [Clostridium sporogenes]|uniref:CRISPR-associated helicase Cas3' n=1 Tax=Clostridium sporogenes TaxID=1509 RepID=UPI0013CF9F52|nr:CRISPR-associated helicase Cas3' [Clostridium sporogenes]NFV11670.1 CRISPR-associated helicase Cas3' [Clostridium sporogenes]